MSSKLILFLGAAFTFFAIISTVSHSAKAHHQMMLKYASWKSEFQKPVLSEEEDMYRFSVFSDNYHYIMEYNQSEEEVRLSLNEFADLTLPEFKALYMGRRPSPSTPTPEFEFEELSTENLPNSVDWRSKGAVTPVKNQGQCGSCWAFSAVGGLEGANFVKSKKLLSFSEQQIVDCSHNGGNSGCNGGDLPPAFSYVVKNGIELAQDYKYTARDGKCKFDASKVAFKPSKYVNVKPNSGDAMAAACVQQPVSICIEADSKVFQFYRSGVIESKQCGTSLDHCVTLVGYNSTSSKPYWIVKNSWGSGWGNNGYVLILKESSGKGVCGVNEEPVYPVA